MTASSTTAVVTVLGPDGYTVTTSVPLTKIDIVKVGQTAQVTTPSTDATLTGTVSSIGVLDTSTTADPAYTVELALDPTDAQLYDGASAQVHLSVAGADQVLTVPTSAVHVDGATATVQVLKDGTPTDVTVDARRGRRRAHRDHRRPRGRRRGGARRPRPGDRVRHVDDHERGPVRPRRRPTERPGQLGFQRRPAGRLHGRRPSG